MTRILFLLSFIFSITNVFSATVLDVQEHLKDIRVELRNNEENEIELDRVVKRLSKALDVLRYGDNHNRHNNNTSAQKCIRETKKGMLHNEYDDLSENLQIVKACALASRGTNLCIQSTKKGLLYHEHDHLSESLQITKACAFTSRGTSQCIQSTKKGQLYHEHDHLSESLQITKACAFTSRGTSQCIQSTKHGKRIKNSLI